jgi:ArsR family transcriptional regulator
MNGNSIKRQSSELNCAEKLKVLADRTRLAVMESLMVEPSHVGRLAEMLDVEQSLLSHHLKGLRDAGLVVAERQGQAVLYRAAPETEVQGTLSAINLGCCQLHFEPGLVGIKKS